MALPEPVRSYFVGALELPGMVLADTLDGLPDEDPIWDFSPDPSRFTLREALCHWADWNDVFLDRLERTRDEDRPNLPDMDEGKMAEERDYAHASPSAMRAKFLKTRADLTEMIKSLSPDQWSRPAHRVKIGDVTISDQIALIGAHDAYHMRQIFDYRTKFAAGR